MSKEPLIELLQQLNIELCNKGVPLKYYGYFQNLWIYLNAASGFLPNKEVGKSMGCSEDWGKSMLDCFEECSVIKIDFDKDPNKSDRKLRRKIIFLIQI